jgi:hypothetical protein
MELSLLKIKSRADVPNRARHHVVTGRHRYGRRWCTITGALLEVAASWGHRIITSSGVVRSASPSTWLLGAVVFRLVRSAVRSVVWGFGMRDSPPISVCAGCPA